MPSNHDHRSKQIHFQNWMNWEKSTLPHTQLTVTRSSTRRKEEEKQQQDKWIPSIKNFDKTRRVMNFFSLILHFFFMNNNHTVVAFKWHKKEKKSFFTSYDQRNLKLDRVGNHKQHSLETLTVEMLRKRSRAIWVSWRRILSYTPAEMKRFACKCARKEEEEMTTMTLSRKCRLNKKIIWFALWVCCRRLGTLNFHN